MAKYVVISASGNPQSNSRRMGRMAFASLQKAGVQVDWLDLRDLALPLCDADACYGAEGARQLHTAISAADGIMVAAPVYNYDVSASAKNMIELSGKAWEDKVVAFLCAAGGMSSYMSVMAYANSLMLDFRSVIVPRFVYATGSAFDGDAPADAKIVARIDQVAAELIRFTEALRGARAGGEEK
ncbi:MAG: NADPH-dependent FMN reductase [Chthoniobacterales bacterium]